MNITTNVLDFEAAAKRRIAEEFPSAAIQGCFFHLPQSIWRIVQGAGLVREYTNSQGIRHLIKAPCSLAFLDVNEVELAFEDLHEKIDTHYSQRLNEIYDYFEDTLIC